MAQATSTLPEGWSKILDEVRQQLDTALAAADLRSERMPRFESPSLAHGQQDEFARLCKRLHGLSERLLAAQTVIQNADADLQAEEALLQQNQVTNGSLRQKLAEWAGRAIG